MRYEILDDNGNVLNTIVASQAFVEQNYPGRWREIAESQTPIRIITVSEFTERMGFPALSNVAVFIRGGIPPTRTTAGTLEEQGTVDAAWKYAQQLGTLDLTTQSAADLLGLLASLSLISWGDVETLLSGGRLSGAI